MKNTPSKMRPNIIHLFSGLGIGQSLIKGYLCNHLPHCFELIAPKTATKKRQRDYMAETAEKYGFNKGTKFYAMVTDEVLAESLCQFVDNETKDVEKMSQKGVDELYDRLKHLLPNPQVPQKAKDKINALLLIKQPGDIPDILRQPLTSSSHIGMMLPKEEAENRQAVLNRHAPRHWTQFDYTMEYDKAFGKLFVLQPGYCAAILSELDCTYDVLNSPLGIAILMATAHDHGMLRKRNETKTFIRMLLRARHFPELDKKHLGTLANSANKNLRKLSPDYSCWYAGDHKSLAKEFGKAMTDKGFAFNPRKTPILAK